MSPSESPSHPPPVTPQAGATDATTLGSEGLDRRQLIARAAVAGTIAWVAPSIIAVSPAAAVGSNDVLVTGTSDLWKWNANPPTPAGVCSTGPNGNASRGSALFTRNCTANPNSISVGITVVSGPALSGTNAREVVMLQSNANGDCLLQTSLGSFNSANNQLVTFGPTPVTSGATHFAMVMLQTGGGGTDTYTTSRINLTC